MDEDTGKSPQQFLQEIHDYVATTVMALHEQEAVRLDPDEVTGRLLGYIDGLAYIVGDLLEFGESL